MDGRVMDPEKIFVRILRFKIWKSHPMKLMDGLKKKKLSMNVLQQSVSMGFWSREKHGCGTKIDYCAIMAKLCK